MPKIMYAVIIEQEISDLDKTLFESLPRYNQDTVIEALKEKITSTVNGTLNKDYSKVVDVGVEYKDAD